MDEMEMLVPEEEEEMVELMEKRSGLTLPTPKVEDAGMLMGMGKRSLRYEYIWEISIFEDYFLVDTKPQGFWEQRVCTRRWFWQGKRISFYEIGISGFLCFISFALSLQFEGMERLSKGLRGSFVAGFSKSALGQSY